MPFNKTWDYPRINQSATISALCAILPEGSICPQDWRDKWYPGGRMENPAVQPGDVGGDESNRIDGDHMYLLRVGMEKNVTEFSLQVNLLYNYFFTWSSRLLITIFCMIMKTPSIRER
jgi:hypothetical protein